MSKFHDNYLKKLLPTEFSGKKQKKFFEEKKSKIFFCKKYWFVKKYLALVKKWWFIIKIHSLVHIKTHFGHQFMIKKIEKMKKSLKKNEKKFFWKNLICEKLPKVRQKMMIHHKMYLSWVNENVF